MAPLPSPGSAHDTDQQRARLAAGLVTPESLDRYRHLVAFARTTVESRFAGRHKSAELGTGGEFAEFTRYVPGLPTSGIDWRLYGRSLRLYLRRFEELSDMTVHLVVDTSGSMRFGTPGNDAKALRAARTAAALAYLMIRQGDKTSLTLFNDVVRHHLPAGGTQRHFHQMLRSLVTPAYGASGPTRIADSLAATIPLLKPRGRVVLLSDFLGEDPEAVLTALGPLLHRGHEILLLQLSDPAERTLPDIPLARFIDMETHEEIQVEPAEIRHRFEKHVAHRTEILRRGSLDRGIDFAVLRTERPYQEAIEAYLGFRQWNTL
ncbi:uncharacterized protein (DUF58 family) [Haloferula luteola]|uniref:Uncharacterized protein (DUF58 family) n=1 Tax=Haloferula luteola TaxID=595692 RepID=A0A840VCG3_9BACT|nr:DUF58 domain-containing protein [Haloferula luteola]MBB5351489.1 uncharacterized protein (DUF58 family) [Haloferula luteola]